MATEESESNGVENVEEADNSENEPADTASADLDTAKAKVAELSGELESVRAESAGLAAEVQRVKSLMYDLTNANGSDEPTDDAFTDDDDPDIDDFFTDKDA